MRNCERIAETKGETEKYVSLLLSGRLLQRRLHIAVPTNFSYSQINEFLVTNKPHSEPRHEEIKIGNSRPRPPCIRPSELSLNWRRIMAAWDLSGHRLHFLPLNDRPRTRDFGPSQNSAFLDKGKLYKIPVTIISQMNCFEGPSGALSIHLVLKEHVSSSLRSFVRTGHA